MSKLVSSVELKKADGKPISFNFQFENGLTMKPILNISGSIWYSDDEKCYGVSIILTKSDLNKVVDYKVNMLSFHETDNSLKENLWVHLENCYLVMQNVDKVNTDKLKKNAVAVLFFNDDKVILN